MLIAAFTLSAILIFYNMDDIPKKNHELSLQQTQAAIMRDYARRMENLYEDVRSFRHEYQNILYTCVTTRLPGWSRWSKLFQIS